MRTTAGKAAVLSAVAVAIVLGGSIVQASRGTASSCSANGSSATQIRHADGANPDDSVDDSLPIQQAIDAAARAGGAVVQLPAGRFDLDRSLVLKSNVELKGAGPSTVLKATSNFLDSEGPHGGHPLITTDGATNVTISQLTADQSGDVLNGDTAGRLNEYLVDVRHSSNALVEGVSTTNPFTYSIAVVDSSNFCVRNNTTAVTTNGRYNQLDGIHITDSHSGVVEGNHVDQGKGADGDDGLVAQTIGAPVYDVLYRNNDVRGGPHGSGMQIAVGNNEAFNITVANNRFWGSPNGIRTGYYGGSAAIHDIVISGNTFTDNAGPSVYFTGQLTNIHVTGSAICRSGDVKVTSGEGNDVSDTKNTC
ncbi:glycosyl hydrolase family 28-related protein [Arthrobacter sp. KNU40]|uniref:glycosyl hydrolase family 28-related protein n=1 Tax=Arthrobacter sp. KNU40 TaxID=3447965 RepID=UPI003F6139F2